MAEQYAHTLIAVPKDFVPSAIHVQSFLSELVMHQVVPSPTTCIIRTPSNRTREVRNPFTGKTDIWKLKDHKKLQYLTEIASTIEGLRDFEIAIAGAGRPKTSPLPIEFTDPYHIGVTCFISSALCSTSDVHLESTETSQGIRYGEPCEAGNKTLGLFNNPHNGKAIRVEGAGCARFWIEFELGKLLFPPIVNGDLQILNPKIVELADRTFGIQFVQGCYWG